MDSSDISIPSSGSRLLSESSLRSGENEPDLSLSDLSIGADEEHDRKDTGKSREEKLQHDLFVLRKINASFGAYREALRSTQSANERVAAQLEQTDALLNKYMGILSKSEDFSRLVFDEQWYGAQQDEDIIEQERVEAEQKAWREAEERAQALRREQERLEQERHAATVREEKERLERERKEKMGARGSAVRGVRGTRASMRGTRGGRGHAPSLSSTRNNIT